MKNKIIFPETNFGQNSKRLISDYLQRLNLFLFCSDPHTQHRLYPHLQLINPEARDPDILKKRDRHIRLPHGMGLVPMVESVLYFLDGDYQRDTTHPLAQDKYDSRRFIGYKINDQSSNKFGIICCLRHDGIVPNYIDLYIDVNEFQVEAFCLQIQPDKLVNTNSEPLFSFPKE